MSAEQALYLRDGEAFVGTTRTQGRWHDNAQIGSALLALLGHVVEEVPTVVPMSLSRLTVELMRPVPIGKRIYIESSVVRAGKRVQIADLVVRTSDAVYAIARAVRMLDADLSAVAGVPSTTTDENPSAPLPRPEELPALDCNSDVANFFKLGAELRLTTEPVNGRHGLWIRLRVPVVAGEAIRATSRATLLMDCVNLIGVRDLDASRVTAINPDVTAHIARGPVDEWVALTGNTWYAHDVGHGISAATLSDSRGVFGVTSTSQLVQPLR
jgi:hypothetical protein